MSAVETLFVFAFLGSFLTTIEADNQKQYYRGVFCNFSDKYFYPNATSRAKSYNRSFSSITILSTAREPINDIFLQISYDYKYGNIYRDVLHTPVFDYCQVVNGGSSNPLIAQLIPNPETRQNIDSLVHPCPYLFFNIRDFAPQLGYMQIIWPSGDYRTRYSLTTKGEFLCFCRMYITVTSRDKHSFG